MEGQHRLGGIKLYLEETNAFINVPFLAFHYLEDEEEISLFDTINTKAKGIGSSLSQYLKMDSEDLSWVAAQLIIQPEEEKERRRIMEITPVVLIGDRVKIQPMEDYHVQELFDAGNNPDIWAHMPMRVQSIEDMKSLVNGALQAREQGSEFPFVIFDKNSGKIVGSTRFLNISIPNRNLEIGWTWLSPTVWRTRINTECKYLLLKHCFETLGTIRVQLKTDSRNVRSQQAIERLGLVKEGVLRNHMVMPDGYLRDSVYYSVIDQEWVLVKDKLESMLQ
ncbi:GNAT family N-acetyltransferase [Bacillus pumilus]|uniref:GNAT family N-acetyltransferase n=1 Tax=Bacillus pumilus TaxID=1408 RepID=UPI000B2E2F94